jgi:soluble lytic murein transglycosylase-like protein
VIWILSAIAVLWYAATRPSCLYASGCVYCCNTLTQSVQGFFYNVINLPQNVSDLIDQIAPQFGLDPVLIKAQAWVESRGKQDAISPAGAIGVMQLEPGTAAALGVNPHDVVENIQGGCKYLAQQLERFGSYTLALAAYNAGPGSVTKYNGIPPYPETQAYVSDILSLAGYSPDGTPPLCCGNQGVNA